MELLYCFKFLQFICILFKRTEKNLNCDVEGDGENIFLKRRHFGFRVVILLEDLREKKVLLCM